MNLSLQTIQNVLNNFLITEGFVLILVNIFIYLLLIILLFGLFFLFDLKFLRTLNELKTCGNLFFITTALIVLFLTFAGIPPLLGFVGKFLLFIFLLNSTNLVVFFLFMVVNFFAIYFYIQNVRFLVTKQSFQFFYFKKYHIFLNVDLIFFLLFLLCLNIIGFCIIDDLTIVFVLLNSFFYLN